jgi:hypothetical protein
MIWAAPSIYPLLLNLETNPTKKIPVEMLTFCTLSAVININQSSSIPMEYIEEMIPKMDFLKYTLADFEVIFLYLLN